MTFCLKFNNGEGRMFAVGRGNQKWNASEAIKVALEKKRAAALQGEAATMPEPSYRFDGTLPFTNPDGMEQWFTQNKANLLPPGVLTGDGETIMQFQAQLIGWYNEDASSRQQMLDTYTSLLQAGRFAGTGRYDGNFFRVLTRQLMPFDRQASEVTQMLDACLRNGGENGKELVRAFFLNPPEKPGFRQIVESGEKVALLASSHPYINFLANHPGLFTIEEKASIMGEGVAYPINPLWWNKMLETPPVEDLPTILRFIRSAEQFSDNIRRAGKKAPALSGNIGEESARAAFFFRSNQTVLKRLSWI